MIHSPIYFYDSYLFYLQNHYVIQRRLFIYIYKLLLNIQIFKYILPNLIYAEPINKYFIFSMFAFIQLN